MLGDDDSDAAPLSQPCSPAADATMPAASPSRRSSSRSPSPTLAPRSSDAGATMAVDPGPLEEQADDYDHSPSATLRPAAEAPAVPALPADDGAIGTDQFLGDFAMQLHIFYERLFPFKDFYRWLNYSNVNGPRFGFREFSFTLASDAYLRFQSFKDSADLRQEILKLNPVKIDIGAVYNSMPKDRKLLRAGAFNPLERELVFDIDMTDYDPIRSCCSDANICNKCWTFMTAAIKVIDRALREDFGFKHRLWVFSGRRGVHCWVCDDRARKLSQDVRRSILNYLEVVRGGEGKAKKVQFSQRLHPSLRKAQEILEPIFLKRVIQDQDILRDPEMWGKLIAVIPDEESRKRLERFWTANSVAPAEKWSQISQVLNELAAKSKHRKVNVAAIVSEIIFEYSYPRLDANVTHGLGHLLKSPFCVHPKTGRVCVPIDPTTCESFDPFSVPTLTDLIDELNKFEAKKPGVEVDDFMKTSLAPYIEHFRGFLKSLELEHKAVRDKQRNEAERGLGF